MSLNSLLGIVVAWALGIATIRSDSSAQEQPRLSPFDSVVKSGLNYLAKEGQDASGMFSPSAGPGVTALAITAALRLGRAVDDPMVAKGLKAMEGFVKPDGGIYGNSRLMNYETCVGVKCFAEANRVAKDNRYKKILDDAKNFLVTMQYGGSTGDDINDPAYGGAGYGGKGRPDLSNTAYLLEALRSLDAPSVDPAIQRAIGFISRCQNLSSPHNPSPLASKVNDGGFYYVIPTEKDIESGSQDANASGGLRSYGSMTYSGLKSMIYAGLQPDDIRVKAASDWIAKNYSVTENPGMADAGLYYYYHTFAAALKALGHDTVIDPTGNTHDWRTDLVEHLAKTQQENGSWQNTNQRWFESDPNLATTFALLALSHCQK